MQVVAWCKECRHYAVREQQKAFSRALGGHFEYSASPGTSMRLLTFVRRSSEHGASGSAARPTARTGCGGSSRCSRGNFASSCSDRPLLRATRETMTAEPDARIRLSGSVGDLGRQRSGSTRQLVLERVQRRPRRGQRWWAARARREWWSCASRAASSSLALSTSSRIAMRSLRLVASSRTAATAAAMRVRVSGRGE